MEVAFGPSPDGDAGVLMLAGSMVENPVWPGSAAELVTLVTGVGAGATPCPVTLAVVDGPRLLWSGRDAGAEVLAGSMDEKLV